MVTEQEEEEQQLAAQRVDVFVRSEDEAEWQAVGQGTVMWMPDGDRQRLMVLGGEEEPSVRPLGSVVLPSERPAHTPDPARAPLARHCLRLDALACRRLSRRPGCHLQHQRGGEPDHVGDRGRRLVRDGLP